MNKETNPKDLEPERNRWNRDDNGDDVTENAIQERRTTLWWGPSQG